MAEDLEIAIGNKEYQYTSLIPQVAALIGDERDLIANLANICGALKTQFNFFWIGFYLVKDEELVLGPFQGPVACTRIAFGKGVCGKSWEARETIIVPDVDLFPGHIACNSSARSEIVVPIIENDIVMAVLDVDSDLLDHFDQTDATFLKIIVDLLIDRDLFERK